MLVSGRQDGEECWEEVSLLSLISSAQPGNTDQQPISTILSGLMGDQPYWQNRYNGDVYFDHLIISLNYPVETILANPLQFHSFNLSDKFVPPTKLLFYMERLRIYFFKESLFIH